MYFGATNSEIFGRPKYLRGTIDLHSFIRTSVRPFVQNIWLELLSFYFFQTVCNIDTLDTFDVVSKKCIKSALVTRTLDTFQTPHQYSSAAVAAHFRHFLDTESIQQCSCCCALQTLFRHQINTVVQLLLRFLYAFSTPNQYSSAAVAALFIRFFYTKSIQQCSCCCAFQTLFIHQIDTQVQFRQRFYDAFSTPNRYTSAILVALL